MIHYKFLTSMGGIPPEKLDAMDAVWVEEQLYIDMMVKEKEEREMKRNART